MCARVSGCGCVCDFVRIFMGLRGREAKTENERREAGQRKR